MSTHVRVRCRTTGAVAALPERAIDLGMFPMWEKVDGPLPRRNKPSVKALRKKTADEPSAIESEE